MHSALCYSGETDIHKSDGDVFYPSFVDIRAWERGNSNHQKFMSTIYVTLHGKAGKKVNARARVQ